MPLVALLYILPFDVREGPFREVDTREGGKESSIEAVEDEKLKDDEPHELANELLFTADVLVPAFLDTYLFALLPTA